MFTRDALATRCIAGCREAEAPLPLLSRHDSPWIFNEIYFNLQMSCNVKLRRTAHHFEHCCVYNPIQAIMRFYNVFK